MPGSTERFGAWNPCQQMIDTSLLQKAEDGTLFLLADKFEGKIALYRDENSGVVKTARSESIPVTAAWEADSSLYISEYGATEVVAEILIGVLGNFSTDILKHCYTVAKIKMSSAIGIPRTDLTDSDGLVRMKLARYERDATLIEGFEYEGALSGLQRALEVLGVGTEDEGDDK